MDKIIIECSSKKEFNQLGIYLDEVDINEVVRKDDENSPLLESTLNDLMSMYIKEILLSSLDFPITVQMLVECINCIIQAIGSCRPLSKKLFVFLPNLMYILEFWTEVLVLPSDIQMLDDGGHKYLILKGLSEHFSALDEKIKENHNQNGENQNNSVDSISYTQLNIMEETIIIHINFVITQDQELGNESLRYMKSSKASLLTPFNLYCLLSMARIHRFQDSISNNIRRFDESQLSECTNKLDLLAEKFAYSGMIGFKINEDTDYKMVTDVGMQNNMYASLLLGCYGVNQVFTLLGRKIVASVTEYSILSFKCIVELFQFTFNTLDCQVSNHAGAILRSNSERVIDNVSLTKIIVNMLVKLEREISDFDMVPEFGHDILSALGSCDTGDIDLKLDESQTPIFAIVNLRISNIICVILLEFIEQTYDEIEWLLIRMRLVISKKGYNDEELIDLGEFEISIYLYDETGVNDGEGENGDKEKEYEEENASGYEDSEDNKSKTDNTPLGLFTIEKVAIKALALSRFPLPTFLVTVSNSSNWPPRTT
nr:6570_t:CDS:10 [Entrophospora candida]